MPFGDVIPFLAFYSSNLIVYWAGWDVNWKLFVAIAFGFVLLAVFRRMRGAETPRMDWRAGATWALPWLGGLCLISYLGTSRTRREGQHGRDRVRLGFRGRPRVHRGRVRARHVVAPAARPREEHIDEAVAEAKEEEKIGVGPVGGVGRSADLPRRWPP